MAFTKGRSMINDFLNNVTPIIIPILFMTLGFYLVYKKGLNQTKVFLSVGALIGLTLGLVLAISFNLDILNSIIIIGVFILFGIMVLAILNIIMTKAKQQELKRKK